MKISYQQLKDRLPDPHYPSDVLAEELLNAADDSYYIHQWLFNLDRDGEQGMQIVLQVLQDDLGEDYLNDLILLYRNDGVAAERLYQLAYDEKQMMRLVLLCCWNRNDALARKFLHYFIVTPSELDSRTKFVTRVIDICIVRQTPHVVEETLKVLPENATEKIIFLLEKCFQNDNQQISDVIIQHCSLEKSVDVLMGAANISPHPSRTCDWLLRDSPVFIWSHMTTKYPEILEHIYSRRRILLESLNSNESSGDETDEDNSGRKKI